MQEQQKEQKKRKQKDQKPRTIAFKSNKNTVGRKHSRMDSSNCSIPYTATDTLFLKTKSDSCESSMIVFWVLATLVCFTRVLLVCWKWKRYFERRSRRIVSSPVGSILESVLTCSYIVFLILTGNNVINVYNGLSFSIFSIVYLAYATSQVLGVIRIVRLGTKIAAAGKQIEEDSKHLERLDLLGGVLFGASYFCLIIMSVALIIVSPIDPQADFFLGTIGWASKGFFQTFICLAAAWQIQRIQNTIKLKMPDSPMRQNVLWRLTRMQLYNLVLGCGAGLFLFLVSAQVIPWYVWSTCFPCVFWETFAVICVELIRNRKRSGSTKSSQFQQHQIPLQNVRSSEEETHADSDKEDDQTIFPLRIIKKKIRKNQRPKLSRITEITENDNSKLVNRTENS